MNRFLVIAALSGSPTNVILTGVPDLQRELELRTHLHNPKVHWDAQMQRAIVEVEDEAQNVQQAEGGVYEEVFESACAVLGKFETIRIEILEVHLSSD